MGIRIIRNLLDLDPNEGCGSGYKRHNNSKKENKGLII